MSYSQSNSLFRFQLPSLEFGSRLRSAGIYLSGILFATGFWVFVDAALYSKVANAGTVHITFVDWLPAICSALGMLIVNSIDKSKLTSDSYGETSMAWKAKLVLFIGFALLAGGLAGGVVWTSIALATSLTGTGGLGIEVHSTIVSISDLIFWNCKCSV